MGGDQGSLRGGRRGGGVLGGVSGMGGVCECSGGLEEGGCGRSNLSHPASAPCCPNPASWLTSIGSQPEVEEVQTTGKQPPVNPRLGNPPAISTA